MGSGLSDPDPSDCSDRSIADHGHPTDRRTSKKKRTKAGDMDHQFAHSLLCRFYLLGEYRVEQSILSDVDVPCTLHNISEPVADGL